MRRRARRVAPGAVAYVVGGSMGIGLAAARALAARGVDLAIFARRAGPLAEAARAVEEARRAPTQRVLWRPLDASDAEATRSVLGDVVAELGAPDVLLNCAGRARPALFENVSSAQLDESLRLNLHTAWNAVQALLPHMRGRGGAIVNTSSLAGLIGVFGYTDYCAAKFALVGFSEALRNELAHAGIAVSVLCPPDTDTPGFAEENRTKPPETRAVSAATRCLAPDEVAAALVDGLQRGRFLIVPGREARLAAFAKRHAPWLVARLLDRTVRRALR